MKKNELKRIIRGIVREEVQMALKKELTEVFKGLKGKPINEKRKVVRKRKPMKNLAQDPVLNKILNETRGGIPQGEGQSDEYPTMGGKTYDTNSMASLMGYGNTNNDIAEQTIQQMGVPSENVPDEVKNAMTRDYSGLMKAIDKKKKNGNGPLKP